jgi:hypothetical protein
VKEHELNTQLAVLQFNPALSSAERNQMLGTVAQLDWINALMVVVSHQIFASYHALGGHFELTPAEIPEGRREWAQQVKYLHDNYGSCVDTHAIAQFDPRLG